MAYEVEALVESPAPQSPRAEIAFKEERVLSPYQSTARSPMNAPSVGQSDIARESLEETRAPEETVRLSPQMALIAKREQKFRLQQQEFEKKRSLLAQKEAEIAQFVQMKQKLEAKDYSALDGLVEYDEYSQYKLNRLNGTDPTQEELRKLSAKTNELEKSMQDNVTKQFEAAVDERRTAARELVESTPDYPKIKKAKAHEVVVQHILDTWENDNQELSIKQAAKEVEEILSERAKQWASLIEEEKPLEEKKNLPPLKQGLKTLTNQVIAREGNRPAPKSLYHMSDSERWAEARRRAEEKMQSQNR